MIHKIKNRNWTYANIYYDISEPISYQENDDLNIFKEEPSTTLRKEIQKALDDDFSVHINRSHDTYVINMQKDNYERIYSIPASDYHRDEVYYEIKLCEFVSGTVRKINNNISRDRKDISYYE